jgi:cytochrome c553
MLRGFTAAVMSSAVSIGSAQAQESLQAGRYLAGNCANCHGTTGHSQGAMPALAGQDAARLVEQLRQFREGKRPATIMHQLVKGYSDDQLAAIAAYFAAQRKTEAP